MIIMYMNKTFNFVFKQFIRFVFVDVYIIRIQILLFEAQIKANLKNKTDILEKYSKSPITMNNNRQNTSLWPLDLFIIMFYFYSGLLKHLVCEIVKIHFFFACIFLLCISICRPNTKLSLHMLQIKDLSLHTITCFLKRSLQ